MKLLELKIHNYGVFRGIHRFNFQVEQKDGKAQTGTVIISGHNGSGKSTLFQSIALALFGGRALGEKTSKREYDNFIMSRLHRWNSNGEPLTSRVGGLELKFQIIDAGTTDEIIVERHWQPGKNLKEELNVFKNSSLLSIDPDNYQAWLNSILLPEFIPLIFVDAEKFNERIVIEEQNEFMQKVFYRLFGIDLVEALENDLKYYIFRSTRQANAEELRTNITSEKKLLQDLKDQLTNIENDYKNSIKEKEKQEVELLKLEQVFMDQGGFYFDHLPALKEKLNTLRVKLENASEQLCEMTSGLLPFSLLPELCSKLINRLKLESQIYKEKIANDLLKQKLKFIENVLTREEAWKGIEISTSIRESVIKRILQLLKMTDGPDFFEDHPIIHQLADSDRERLQNWINQALSVLPSKAILLGNELRTLKKEVKDIELKMASVPDEEFLAPTREKIVKTKEALFILEKTSRTLHEKADSLQLLLAEQGTKIEKLETQLAEAETRENQLVLALRSQAALKAFRESITRRKLEKLEQEIVQSFNILSRKDQFLTDVKIASNDFGVQLLSKNNDRLGENDFSTGEKQLYLLTLLWALRKTNSRNLPLLIDMPLARLDEVHRWRLLNHYLPKISDQVLLFVNDTEFYDSMLPQPDFFVAKLFKLNYDNQQQATEVRCEHEIKNG